MPFLIQTLVCYNNIENVLCRNSKKQNTDFWLTFPGLLLFGRFKEIVLFKNVTSAAKH